MVAAESRAVSQGNGGGVSIGAYRSSVAGLAGLDIVVRERGVIAYFNGGGTALGKHCATPAACFV